MRTFAAGALGLAVLAAILGFAIVASAVSVLGVGGPSTLLPSSAGNGVGGSSTVPPAMLALYQQGAATCTGLPWTILSIDRLIPEFSIDAAAAWSAPGDWQGGRCEAWYFRHQFAAEAAIVSEEDG